MHQNMILHCVCMPIQLQPVFIYYNEYKSIKKHDKNAYHYMISITHNCSTNACLERASDLSILFPRTSKGIPTNDGFVKSSCSSLRDIGTLSLSAASTTYMP